MKAAVKALQVPKKEEFRLINSDLRLLRQVVAYPKFMTIVPLSRLLHIQPVTALFGDRGQLRTGLQAFYREAPADPD